jgi:hypothetical protein
VSAGAIVWVVIGTAWVAWLVATAVVGPLPGFLRLLRSLASSWAGRAIAIAAWGGAGWHLFCQRP